MKRVFAILLSIMIILAAAHMSFAVHYCGGQVAATRFSFTHTLASCGMSSDKDIKKDSSTQISSNCCVNKVSTLVVDNSYYSANFSIKFNIPSYLLSLFVLPENLPHEFFEANRLIKDFKPPGIFALNSVSLPDICVFRI